MACGCMPQPLLSHESLIRPGLASVEDGLGWREARCWPVEPQPGARIYEISGPDRWAELVDRYPVDVTRSRRHDWWRVTHWAGIWLIPDWLTDVLATAGPATHWVMRDHQPLGWTVDRDHS